MKGPRNPTDRTARTGDRPSPKTSTRRDAEDRTLPGRRSPGNEKQRERVVNEDEQLKVVNNREDNAQSVNTSPPEENRSSSQENENERLEAGYDNSEVNPRPPKVN